MRMRYCDKCFQNYFGSVELIEGRTIVWSFFGVISVFTFKNSFFFRFFMLFSYFMLSYFSTCLKYLMNMCLWSEETIFKGGSPCAILILNNMFVVVVLYCVQLLPEVTNFPMSFAKVFFFYFLEFSGMSNFPKYMMPYENPIIKKTAAKHFFKGVVHEQPWSSIVCLLWGSTIVSSCLRWEKNHTFLLPFPLLKLVSFT